MKNHTAGFTLVEIMVGMAAASILMLALGRVLVSGNKIYHHYAAVVRASEAGDAMGELLRTKLQYAKELVIDETAGEEDCSLTGFSKDGVFLLDGKAAYGDLPKEGLLSGCRITLISKESHIIRLELYLTDLSGNLLYQSGESIKLFNMELDDTAINCRIAWKNGVIDSADQDILFCCPKEDRRWGQDE